MLAEPQALAKLENISTVKVVTFTVWYFSDFLSVLSDFTQYPSVQ